MKVISKKKKLANMALTAYGHASKEKPAEINLDNIIYHKKAIYTI